MRKNYLVILFVLFVYKFNYSQVIKTKTIDNGSSGNYKSVAVSEKSLPDFVIYRPQIINEAVENEGKLPVLVWANGGCMNASTEHERFLSELASHGYVIVAIGAMEMRKGERTHKHAPDAELLKALSWISEQAKNSKSDYYQKVDLDKIAAAGMSCGGAQTLRIAGDQRVKTYMICNAGMGDMSMAGASANSLKKLNGKIIYIVGGESDIAYTNAQLDYERINNVPVVFANHKTAGHSGTYAEKFGGSFAKMALDWLDWQFKGKDNSAIFLNNDLSKYPGWTIKSKGFNLQVQSLPSSGFTKPELEFVCELKVTIAQPLNVGTTAHGERIIIPITGGTFNGPNMKGVVLSGGADYQYFNKELGRTELEAIYTIKTNDNILIHVRNLGLLCKAYDKKGEPTTDVYFRTVPKFEAPADSKYNWLNNAIYVCKPVVKNGYVSIRVWKVL